MKDSSYPKDFDNRRGNVVSSIYQLYFWLWCENTEHVQTGIFSLHL